MPSGDIVDPERLEMSGIYFSLMRDIQEQNKALLAEIRQLKKDLLKEELTGQ